MPSGNTKDILDAKREFELAYPVRVLADYGIDNQYAELKPGSGEADPVYLYIEKREEMIWVSL